MKDSKPRILLINSPLTGSLVSQLDLTMEPIGLAYIAAAVERDEYEVKILDALALGYEQIEKLPNGLVRIGLTEVQIIEWIRNYLPDIVGVSCHFTAYARDAHRVAACVKKVSSNIMVVFGGVHASVVPEVVLSDKNVDIVVRGEGEITFTELIKAIHKEKDHTSVKGTVLRVNGTVKYNEPRERIRNLDEVPFPARHLLPMEKYFEFQRKGKVMFRYYMRKPISCIVTSRGCPFNCTFCSVRTIWGRTWRARSAENVVAEIESLVKSYGIKEVSLWDDNVSVDKRRMIQICQGIVEKKLNIRWCTPNGIYLPSLDEEVLTLMAKSGCYRLIFGIESGSDETRRLVRKRVDLNKAREVIDICHRLGIWASGTFIIGFPEEKMESIRATMTAPQRLGLDFASFYIAQPYLGTEMLETFKQLKLIDEANLELSTLFEPKHDTLYFSRQQLMELRDQAYRSLFAYRIRSLLNPRYLGHLLHKINSPERFLYFLRLGGNVISQIYPGSSGTLSIWQRILKLFGNPKNQQPNKRVGNSKE